MSRDEYEAGFSRPEFGLAEAKEVCRRLELRDEPQRLVDGTNLVFRVGGDRWLKIYSPVWPEEFEVESRMLEHVAPRLPVDTPEIVEKGEINGWPFLLLTHVDGIPFDAARAELTLDDRTTVARRLGEAMAALHDAPIQVLSGTGPDWEDFLEKQINTVVERVASSGADGAWISRASSWIADRAEFLRADASRAIIHGDLYFAHVILRRSGSTWDVAGVLDFADARVAPAEFDLVDPVLWLFRGEREPLTALFRALGLSAGDGDALLAERILTWALVHGFVRFADAFKKELQDGSDSMEALARSICPVA